MILQYVTIIIIVLIVIKYYWIILLNLLYWTKNFICCLVVEKLNAAVKESLFLNKNSSTARAVQFEFRKKSSETV